MSPYQLVQIAKQQISGVIRILNDVLTLTRMESNEFRLDFRPFDLHTMIEHMLLEFHSELREKHLACDLDLHPGASHWDVHGDQYRLKQVLSNLLSNACKFSPHKGRIRIAVHQTPIDAPTSSSPAPAEPSPSPSPSPTSSSGVFFSSSSPLLQPGGSRHADDDVEPQSWVRIDVSVTDDGAGMSDAEQSRLFRAYSQIRAADMQKGGGSGLGLNISRGLLHLHGGSLNVTSRLCGGSTFIMSLPMRQVTPSPVIAPVEANPSVTTSSTTATTKSTPPRPPSLSSSSPSSSSPSRDSLRVLIVEDSTVNAKMLAMMLTKLHCAFHVVGDGDECVELFAKHFREQPLAALAPFDLVFMDGHMPRMSGVEATIALRRMGVREPIYALTGNAMREDCDQFKSAGATEVLSKPTNMRTIRNVVHQVQNARDVVVIDPSLAP